MIVVDNLFQFFPFALQKTYFTWSTVYHAYIISVEGPQFRQLGSGHWVPSGARQCPASCGWSLSAVLQAWRHWCYWLACSTESRHLLVIMYCSIHSRHVSWQTVTELADTLIQVWEEIPQEAVCRLTRSGPGRCGGVRTGRWRPHKPLNHIMSCLEEIHRHWFSPWVLNGLMTVQLAQCMNKYYKQGCVI